MERAKILMIVSWLFNLLAMLFMVYLSQGLSRYFTGNQYLFVSLGIFSPLFVVALIALKRVAGHEQIDNSAHRS